MNAKPENQSLTHAEIEAAADWAARQVPPLWPLASSVAVNPFLGQTELTLAETAARLGRAGGIAVTMPRSWYLEQIATQSVTEADLAAALAASPHGAKPADLDALKKAAEQERAAPAPLPNIASLAATASGCDWPGLIAERFGAWAGGYFDEGQALWAAPRGRSAWRAFCAHATHDLTPEILGLSGFGGFVADAPEDPAQAMARALERLGVGGEALRPYLHGLLLSLGGWAQFARFRLWQAELQGGSDATLTDFLAIRLLWEEALFLQHEAAIAGEWRQGLAALAQPEAPGPEDVVDEILQEAAERAAQRRLAESFSEDGAAAPVESARPLLQAAFCIDVRSEVFRRALESVDPSIRTLGFAGFFGVAAKHQGFASDVEELRLPVLLNPGLSSKSGGPEMLESDLAARYSARAKRAWGRFKLAAVSSFAFVEATGPLYAMKLVRDALGIPSHLAKAEPKPLFDPQPDLEARIGAAETILRAMSLTEGFARVVLLAGHGAGVVNNPQASALHCGACGGYSGEANARLLAGLLNEPAVREGLAGRGITIPGDTLFVPGLHNTTTDRVTLYEEDADSKDHAGDLRQVRRWLGLAGALCREERAARLPRAEKEGDLLRRARDWSEVRPEWGLAGCRAFVAAPRRRTAGRDLSGRAFLHDYDWKADAERGFPVLELIVTAPVVVASWISLQYYGSSVAPAAFGAGSKLLHNVVGGMGVLEGYGGTLRGGLAWQSVHDGERYIHEPLRLSVCIEAPREALSEILSRHEGVRSLFDKKWLHLFALDEDGQMAWRYAGDLTWEPTGYASAGNEQKREAS